MCAFVSQAVLFNVLVFQAYGHCLFDNKPLLQSCGGRCLGVPGAGKVTCVSNCLVGKGVRPSCASCLGTGFNCGVNACMSNCISGFSKPICTSCISSNCGLCSRARSSEEAIDNASTIEALLDLFTGANSAAANSTELLSIRMYTATDMIDMYLEEIVKNFGSHLSLPPAQLRLQEEASTRSGCFEVQALMKTCGTQCYSAGNQASRSAHL